MASMKGVKILQWSSFFGLELWTGSLGGIEKRFDGFSCEIGKVLRRGWGLWWGLLSMDQASNPCTVFYSNN